MRAHERERVQRLLDEMGRLNDRMNVLHRATVQELARARHLLSAQQGVIDAMTRDHTASVDEAVALAHFLLRHGELEPGQRDLADRILRSGDEVLDLADELREGIGGPASRT